VLVKVAGSAWTPFDVLDRNAHGLVIFDNRAAVIRWGVVLAVKI
jgi:hypothetical protein